MAPMTKSGNCRYIFGSHFPSFIVCCHQSFLCLFGHSNHFLTTLAETGGKKYAASHTGVLKVTPDTWIVILQMQGLSSVGRRLSHPWITSFGDSDLTDIYLNENLQDYICKALETGNRERLEKSTGCRATGPTFINKNPKTPLKVFSISFLQEW